MVQSYREDCNEVKAKRAGIIEQRPLSKPSKKDKPIVLESRPLEGSFAFKRRGGEWRKWSSYRSVREAEQARDNLARKYARLWEFRVKE